jgi:hypothetical protein
MARYAGYLIRLRKKARPCVEALGGTLETARRKRGWSLAGRALFAVPELGIFPDFKDYRVDDDRFSVVVRSKSEELEDLHRAIEQRPVGKRSRHEIVIRTRLKDCR